MMIPKLYALAMDFALQNDCPKPLHTLPGCWTKEFQHNGVQWWIAINGHKEKKSFQPPGGMDIAVEPFGVTVWRGGWLAAMLDAGGGGAVGCTEDEIIEAIKSTGVKS